MKKTYAQNLDKVDVVSITVNDSCFFRCKMCSFWKKKKKSPLLDLKIFDAFFNDLKKISKPDIFINFTGGGHNSISE